jgi:hypothetical protein
MGDPHSLQSFPFERFERRLYLEPRYFVSRQVIQASDVAPLSQASRLGAVQGPECPRGCLSLDIPHEQRIYDQL